ncbi:uncharacterized protein G2W53_026437 [Senna tora]|uniref:Uncharacterized protein n=1 Tax=Senna tora TaxID=362788 RepID=A0A834TGZ2_9FABA|nr:uncharacterized protein G2W53_026437 [Senna tora]
MESLWHGRSVDHVLTYSGREIAVGSLKPSRITRQNTCYAIGVVMAWEERGSSLNIFRTRNRCWISETFTIYEAKHLLRNAFVAPIGVVMASEERGHVLTYSRRQIASSWLGRIVDHLLTYSGREIVVGSQKPSRITRQNTCCAYELNTSVPVVFANQSGFDAPIGVVIAWEERGSCLNIFRMRNRCRISETFTNYEAKYSLRK